jgi:hypothetical protein
LFRAPGTDALPSAAEGFQAAQADIGVLQRSGWSSSPAHRRKEPAGVGWVGAVGVA